MKQVVYQVSCQERAMNDKLAIEPGALVELELESKSKTREKLEFTLVDDRGADFDKGLLGVSTPLAKAILGHAAGETLEYARGDIVRLHILAVAEGNADSAASAESREEALKRARDKAELSNMVSFALTFDSKWGDYDPEQIVKQYEEDEKKDKP